MSAPAFQVVWSKSWQGRAIYKPCDCKHSNQFGTEVLNINQRLEPKGKSGRSIIALDASVCMDCGSDILGNLTLVESLTAVMDEHGWNREVGLRLYDLAEFHRDELEQGCCPLWMYYGFGLSGKEIVDRLNAGDLVECAGADTSPESAVA